MTKKKRIINLLIYFTIFFLILFFFFKLINLDVVFKKLPLKSQSLLRNINVNNKAGNNFFHFTNNLFNDYNTKFLPETQLIDLNFKTLNVEFDRNYKKEYLKKTDSPKNLFYSFYIEIINNDLLLADFLGNFYLLKIEDLNQKKKKKFITIKSNIKADKVLDTLIYNNKLYISYSNKVYSSKVTSGNCYNFNIAEAEFNKDLLRFKNLYTSKECSKQRYYQTHGGRMQFYQFNKKEGILITIGDNSDDKKEVDSIVGKILFFDFQKNSLMTFSEGHRNAQGLLVYNNAILSTEHGPRGGDEINRIFYKKNYGWPEASYGEPYGNKFEEPIYKKNHKKNNFEEPLFVFSKAIGISELINLPNKFSFFWQNNFLISSLWAQSVYRVKFNDNLNKVIFYEKIFIGQRIRDIKYHKKLNAILLSLEENGKIGFITTK